VANIAKAIGISEGDLDTARGKLDNSHLIKPVDESCNFYTIHPLVREFFALQLKENNPELNSVYRPIFVQFLLNIAKTIPETPNQEMIANLSPVIKHLEHLSETMLDDIPNPEEDLIWAFEGVKRYYDGQGKYELAEIPAEKCVQATESRLGENHLHTADSLNNLANLYESQGRYTEAEPLYVRALAIRQEQLGANHPSTATSLNNLALFYEFQGQLKKAEEFAQRALNIRQSTLGNHHPNTISSLLTVKGVQMQMVLGCDGQTLKNILEEIAQGNGITELNNEIYIQLLELMENNPPLIEEIKQRLSF
jgi:tetratricopeptide (TPR) repeat protein